MEKSPGGYKPPTFIPSRTIRSRRSAALQSSFNATAGFYPQHPPLLVRVSRGAQRSMLRLQPPGLVHGPPILCFRELRFCSRTLAAGAALGLEIAPLSHGLNFVGAPVTAIPGLRHLCGISPVKGTYAGLLDVLTGCDFRPLIKYPRALYYNALEGSFLAVLEHSDPLLKSLVPDRFWQYPAVHGIPKVGNVTPGQ